MDAKTLLVDASYLFKRSLHGVKNSYDKQGHHIGAVYGFLTKIRKLIKDYTINKVVLAWDGENGGIHRHQIDYMYKSNRKDKSWYTPIELTDEEIRAEKEKKESVLLQRKRVQLYAEELFFRQLEVNDIEADDLIAAYCVKHHKTEDILLYTNDKDFLQLLTLDIKIYLESVGKIVEAGNFFEFFPYFYKNALTLKILCGDDSDMIEGVKGIKETTLLKHFPELIDSEVSVRHICKRSVEINEQRKLEKKKPLAAIANITSNIDRLRMNHQLMNLFEPFLNEAAYQALEDLSIPLSADDRGGNNLYKIVQEDDLLASYSNYGNYSSYMQPFYQVISREKDLLKKFCQQ